MQVPEDSSQGSVSERLSTTAVGKQQLKAIAYSLDALIPGL